MTLRCEISIVPFGDEDQTRQIYRLDISNIGVVRDEGFGHTICKYKVNLMGKVLEILRESDTGPEWEHIHTDFVEEHDRRDGAVALVEKACSLVKDQA